MFPENNIAGKRLNYYVVKKHWYISKVKKIIKQIAWYNSWTLEIAVLNFIQVHNFYRWLYDISDEKFNWFG